MAEPGKQSDLTGTAVADTVTDEEELVDIRRAAKMLGVSRSLMYAYVERRQIPHYRIGRTIRFLLSELERWRRRFHVDGGIDEQ